MNNVVTVNFRGAEIYGLRHGGEVYVALKPIVEAMGLSWGSQYNRLKRDLVLSKGIFIMKIPFGAGGPQDYVCLLLKRINGWLFKIEAGRIKDPEIKARVLVYQEECYDVLCEHFSGDCDKVARETNESDSLSLRLVEECRRIWGDWAAAQLWEKLGLPKVPAMDQVFRQLPLPFGKAA